MMYSQGVFEHNEDTITGKWRHDKREQVSTAKKLDEGDVFSIVLYAMNGELCGKLDGVMKKGDEYSPIEDKNSKMPEKDYICTLWGVEIHTNVWINDFAQIVGQMYLLRKNNYRCNKGKVYYRGSNKMLEIAYREEYDTMIENAVRYCKKILLGKVPEPLTDSDKCIRCSLNWACLPDEVNLLTNRVNEARRLYPGRPDGGILYVTAVGSKISKDGESVSVWSPNGEKKSIPRKDIEHICVYGNVQITTQAMNAIVNDGGTISYFTSGGWLNAITTAPITKNIHLRIKQFEKMKQEEFCLELCRNIVLSKIENQRTLLRRNRKENIDGELLTLKLSKEKVKLATSIDSIRGYEGNAARYYWSVYPKMFKDKDVWQMIGRNRRPPLDEVNAMISYGYSLLLRDFVSALAGCGMDYLYGFYHTIVPGRPALALDMMEAYRPIIVDSLVLRMINENIAQKSDFKKIASGVYMTPEIRKKFIHMYEKRMDEMITHPTFGYRLSYRRMINLEAKLLGKYIMEEIETYIPLTTR